MRNWSRKTRVGRGAGDPINPRISENRLEKSSSSLFALGFAIGFQDSGVRLVPGNLNLI